MMQDQQLSATVLENARNFLSYYCEEKEKIAFGFWVCVLQKSLTKPFVSDQDLNQLLMKHKDRLRKCPIRDYCEHSRLFKLLAIDLGLSRYNIDIAEAERFVKLMAQEAVDSPNDIANVKTASAYALFADLDLVTIDPVSGYQQFPKPPFTRYSFQPIEINNHKIIVGPGPHDQEPRDNVINFFSELMQAKEPITHVVAIGQQGIDFSAYFAFPDNEMNYLYTEGSKQFEIKTTSTCVRASQNHAAYKLSATLCSMQDGVKESMGAKTFTVVHIKSPDMQPINLSEEEWQEIIKELKTAKGLVGHCMVGLGRTAQTVWQLLLSDPAIFSEIFQSDNMLLIRKKLAEKIWRMREQRKDFFLLPEQFFEPLVVAYKLYKKKLQLVKADEGKNSDSSKSKAEQSEVAISQFSTLKVTQTFFPPTSVSAEPVSIKGIITPGEAPEDEATSAKQEAKEGISLSIN